MTAVHLCFRAMSTDVGVTVVGGRDADLDWARTRVTELEARWSRFLADSEISRLNTAGGRPMQVSADTVRAVRAACAAWVHTHGLFDPTVHDSLLRLGYDDSIDVVRGSSRDDQAGRIPIPALGCGGVTYDEATNIVSFPSGVRFDLGGIGKGLAADLVATGLQERGARGALVNIGGDVRVVGEPPCHDTWRVDIEDPRTSRPLMTLALSDGGVATSTTLRRRWRQGGRPVHHLVRPTTGQPTDEDVVGVCVIAGTAAWADALSKVPFVDPARTDLLGPTSAVIMLGDGSTETVGRVEQLEPAAS